MRLQRATLLQVCAHTHKYSTLIEYEYLLRLVGGDLSFEARAEERASRSHARRARARVHTARMQIR